VLENAKGEYMYHSDFRPYMGKLVGMDLYSDPFNGIYGILWLSHDNIYVSDHLCITGSVNFTDISSLLRDGAIFNNPPIRFDDVRSIQLARDDFFSEQLRKDIDGAAAKIRNSMNFLGYFGYDKAAPVIDMSRFPHKCTYPGCGSPAYIGGMNNVECSNEKCQNYKA
jgi:hypothetical protein